MSLREHLEGARTEEKDRQMEGKAKGKREDMKKQGGVFKKTKLIMDESGRKPTETS